MNRTLAYFAVILGTLGLLACIVGIVATWTYSGRVTRSGLALLETVDETLDLAEVKSLRAYEGIGLILDVVRPTTRAIANLSEKGKDAMPGEEKELQRLSTEVMTRLRTIEKMVEAGRSILETVNAAAKAVEKMPFASGLASRLTSVDNLQGTTDSLDRLSAFLDRVHHALAEFRQNKELRQEIATEIARLAGEAEERLKTTQGRLDNLRSELKNARAEVAEVRSRLPVWVTTADILVTVLLVWMGLGQWALLRCGLANIGKAPPITTSAR